MMNAGVLNSILPTALALSIVLTPGRNAFAQTTESPLITIVASDHHAAEAEQEVGAFTVSRTGPTAASLLVFYELSGTALNGVDYLELPRSITIPAGAASAPITIKPINDSLAEGTETVVATLVPSPTLSPIEPYRVGFPGSDVILLSDNDTPPANPPPSVRILSPTNNATFIAPATIVLVAHAEPIRQVHSVEFFAGDRRIGLATFEPTKCSVCPVWVLEWTNVLAGEYTLTAKVTDELGASAVSEPVKIAVRSSSVKPVVNIEATDAEAAEISPLLAVPPNPAVFKVTRTGETSKALKVFYRLTGTAGNGVDYRELSGSVTIPEGAGSAGITVQPIDDALVEGKESVVATIVPLSLIDPPVGSDPYAVGSNARAEAHILDNDEPPPNALPAVKIVRPAGGSTFPAPATINIVVEVRDPDGWVELVEFFVNERKIGEQSVVFIREPDPGQVQSFSFEWKEIPHGEYTLVARATDNRAGKGASDPVRVRVGEATPLIPVVTIFARDASAGEGTNSSGEINTATFVLRRTGETNAGLTVFLSVHGTAENGVDYETLPNSVTIPAGHHTARIVVKPIRDEQKEPLETVLLALEPDPSLGPVARYSVGEPSKAAATIADSNQPPPADVRTADGMFHLCVPGENGFGYKLECSTDLTNWMPLGTNVVTDGAIHFVDPDADGHAHRFYRVVPETNVDLED